jgi:HAD superfamily hydrolase (TIGR01509 family)
LGVHEDAVPYGYAVVPQPSKNQKNPKTEKTMKITGAIFDLDGTLVDSLHFWDVYFAEVGEKYLSDRSFIPDPDTLKLMRTATIGSGQTLLHERYGFGRDPEELISFAYEKCEYFYRNLVTVKDGVFDLLDHLKENNVKMCIASATEMPLLMVAVERFGFNKYFPRIVSCSEVGVGKDRPDVFLFARDYLQTQTDQTCIFEDSVVAIETSVKAGFKTVGIYDDHGLEHEKMKKLSDIYIDNGQTMASLIGRLEF